MKPTRGHPTPAHHREDDDRPRDRVKSSCSRSRWTPRRWTSAAPWRSCSARKVASVRTQIQHGKFKRQGRFQGQRSDWKKAWVRLKAGEKVPEFFEGA